MNIEKIRKDFPALQQKINGKPVVYLDNACMTLRPRQVIDAQNRYYEEYPGCAGRSIHKFGNIVTEEYDKARETIAKFIGAKKPEEIVFTRNTTEGINLVAHSLPLKKGDIVLTTDREHNSNLIPWQILRESVGIEHKIVPSNSDFTFSLEKFEETMDKNVKLVSVVHTSNLDGYTVPAKEIIKIAHDYGALVMLDGAQSVPHKEINVKKLDCDILAFSGHKMLGPSGIGVLYAKYHILEEMKPFLVGGDTVAKTTYTSYELLKPPEKFEAGLQNYAGAIGLAAAAKYLDDVGKENIERHERELNNIVNQELVSMDGVEIIGVKDPNKRSGVTSFVVDGIEYHDIAIILDETANVMVRSGQHCLHSWFNAQGIKGSVRSSLYLYNTREDIEIFIETMKNIIKLR